MLPNTSTENQRAVIDAYKTLQTELHTSSRACSQHSLKTSARCCSNSLTGPLQMHFHRLVPNSSGRTAILPCPVHPAGWSTLTLTHGRSMHIWLVNHEFPGIRSERHLAGYWHIHSREKAWGQILADDCIHAHRPKAALCLQPWTWGRGGSLKHLLLVPILHI